MSTAVAKCRDCAAPIYWLHAVDDARKLMPVNAVPEAGRGNIEVDLNNSTYHVLSKVEVMLSPQLLFTSHFVTCPNAGGRRNKPIRSGVLASP